MTSELRAQLERIRTPAGRDLAMALHTRATLVQEYSDDPDNPNVSAWLRGGAVDLIVEIEKQALRR